MVLKIANFFKNWFITEELIILITVKILLAVKPTTWGRDISVRGSEKVKIDFYWIF